ncbi:alpha/beta fold hydrolase, partial [Jatrophihabitans endophyticus]|uniref:alpha/beta fold hydrolase n=1 Tax=Jatrophihabitans endophyticus TaxID=1206085 RepID=UPI0019DE50BF
MAIDRRALDVRGHRLTYLTDDSSDPDAPVVLLLHGLASDADTWDRVVPLLAGRGLRPVALDLPGHGGSDPAGSYLLEDLADEVLAFLDAAGVARATLVGHSLGGAIAMTVADAAPDRVRALVLA